MNKDTIRKILDDEETLDVAKVAKAQRALKPEKPSRTITRQRQMEGFRKKILREQEEETFRKKLSKIWNKINS